MHRSCVTVLITSTIFLFVTCVTAQSQGENVRETIERLEQDLAQALERISELEALVSDLAKSGTIAGSNSGTTSMTELPTTIASVEEGGFLIEIQSCSKVDDSVSCDLLMTSQNEDQDVCINLGRTNPRGWGIGVDYRPVSVSLGSQSDTSIHGSGACNKLIQGISITSAATLSADTSPGQSLARMDLAFEVGERTYTASFTNIPLQ